MPARVSRGVVALALLLTALLPPVRPAAAQAAGLPTHFGVGLIAHPDGDEMFGWMPQSGVPWDYAAQYLAGGVDTGAGWETWSPNGTFASNYAQSAAERGAVPVLVYYELFQSTGSCGRCDENRKDLTNLNDPSLMQKYYANFSLLMQRLGGFGRTAIVNVEPDFVGGYAVQAANQGRACFGFCSRQGNDPSLLNAAVASTGVPDVAGYPNTYSGYLQSLAHLRDLYAPNVLLGLEVSPWATGVDVGSSGDPNIDATTLGQQVGSFLAQAAPHDVLFNDPLDRDAGQYRVQFNQNRWWDRDNLAFPNFRRWEQYLQAAAQADSSRPILLWQVPVGNQYFQTENNTPGHFQDNRAEYIFGHIDELVAVGIVGAIFGSGNAGNTTYSDASHDGVSNPPSFCTHDGSSTGTICNDHPSSLPDDDGGFLRLSAQQYYANPVPLSLPGS